MNQEVLNGGNTAALSHAPGMCLMEMDSNGSSSDGGQCDGEEFE